MADHTSSQASLAGFTLPWSWCSRCQRAFVTGTARTIRFQADSRQRDASLLALCAYADCSGSARRIVWPWVICRAWHPEYPVTPTRDVVYPALLAAPL